MKLSEIIFRNGYAQESLYLNQAWLAFKSDCQNVMNKAFENAARVRPTIESDEAPDVAH